MKITVAFQSAQYEIDLAQPLDISIPVHFEGGQLSAFGAPPAKKEAYKAGSFIGDVSQGGSCNCETYTVTPHCNGTHTESIGHLTSNHLSIHEMLKDSFIPATLITITPEQVANSSDKYIPKTQPDDLMVTKKILEQALQGHNPDFIEALVIRTLPNDKDKISRNYDAGLPPFMSNDAVAYLNTLPIKHLLIDMPSVDRMDDDGRLSSHRVFWGVSSDATEAKPSPKTVTELIYVENAIENGCYLLNLQVAPFLADAAPSRPILYKVKSL